MNEASQTRLLVVGALAWIGPTRLLLQRRSPQASHGALRLELAGGKVERGESPRIALRRELSEEWGPGAARVPIGPIADVLHHIYPPPGPEIVLVVYHVDARANDEDATLEPVDGARLVAVDAAAPPLTDVLEADRPLVQAVAEGRLRCPFPDR